MDGNDIITVDKVTKKFGDFTAVDDVSFSVKKGGIFAFLGPNGAGKTTTIKMLTTILHATKGDLHVDGHCVRHDQRAVRRSFGIVFQDPSLDDELTAFENLDVHGVLYGVEKKTRRQRIDRLLRFVGLWDRKDDLVKHFSGGMKRRLEMARGLVHHPAVLFLDEPTLGLDPQTRNSIWDYLKQLNKDEGMTIFFTTHYMEEAEKAADTVAVIDKGRIIGIGSPKELMKSTNTKTLEDAFLKFTGRTIRDQDASNIDRLRMASRVWRR